MTCKKEIVIRIRWILRIPVVCPSCHCLEPFNPFCHRGMSTEQALQSSHEGINYKKVAVSRFTAAYWICG